MLARLHHALLNSLAWFSGLALTSLHDRRCESSPIGEEDDKHYQAMQVFKNMLWNCVVNPIQGNYTMPFQTARIPPWCESCLIQIHNPLLSSEAKLLEKKLNFPKKLIYRKKIKGSTPSAVARARHVFRKLWFVSLNELAHPLASKL